MAASRTPALALLRRIWPTAAVGILAVVLVVGAAVAPGFPAADLDLHDGSVWVTNKNERLVGKVNKQINDLESSAQLVNKDFDVVQNGKSVFVIDETAHQAQLLDPATTTLGTPVQIPSEAQLSAGRGDSMLVDPRSGRAWIRSTEELLNIDFSKAKADWRLERHGLGVMAPDGTPVGLSLQRNQLVRAGATEPETTDLPFEFADDADVELSMADGTAVVLDRSESRVWVEGWSEPLVDERLAAARLQAPSNGTVQTEAGTFVAVMGTSKGLLGVTDDRTLVALAPDSQAGDPVQPVVVAGCAYGATTGDSAQVATVCSGREPKLRLVPQYTTADEVTFRVNRDVVVLNGQRSGKVWMVTDAMQLIQDWTKVTPPTPEKGKSSNNNEQVTRVDPVRDEENRPPTANDDEFGVRAERSTMIPVIENDNDPDGDILTVTDFTTPEGVRLDTVRGGTGLQVTVDKDTRGRVAFTYTISDGRGGTDTAKVTLTVRDSDPNVENNPPQMKDTVEPLNLTLGDTAERRVLLDWRDPDGDDLVLVKAEAPGDDEVRFTADGMLTFVDVGTQEGRKAIKITVSDGVAEAEGEIVVNAVKRGGVPPLANGDYYEVNVGEELLAKPLANDVGNNLALRSAIPEKPANNTVAPNWDDNTFTFKATKAGTYYVGYIVSNGPQAFGLVRIDVRDPEEKNRAPVATRDTALLPAGGQVLIDPLANDEDLDNDVLVLQNVSTDPSLQVRMIQRQMLEIKAVTTSSEPITLTYTVSDGHESSEGTIVVIPAPPAASDHPVARPDQVTVLAGDTVSVRALANDMSPAGLKLTIDDELPEEPLRGAAWVDGEYVRFAAPQEDGVYTAVYQVRDEHGQTASASIRFSVVSRDVPNTPPQPKVVEGRVLAGTMGRIVIPLHDIDAEGDSVRLLGLDSGPKLGRVVKVDERWLEYEAYPESRGTDTFTYAVTDGRGAKAVGQVRVGVVPRGAANTPPTAIDDPVTARPGRTVRVSPLLNDSDPDGDPFGYAPKNALDFGDIPAEIVGSDIQFEMPEKPGQYQGAYSIRDARGAESTGYVLITSDSSAPLMAPVAVDDIVSSADVSNKSVIEVPVLDNDYDPDGDAKDLTLSIPENDLPEDEQPTVVGRSVRVTVGPTMRQVRYEITDGDGLTDWGVITVPGVADAVPALKPDIAVQEVIAGEELVLPVNDFVVGTRGRQVKLTAEDRMWGSNGEVKASDVQTVVFRAPETYVGPAAATFEVTDGDLTDDTARQAVVTIPIKVLPPPKKTEDPDEPEKLNQPPVANPMTLTIGAGEGPKSIDMATSVTDPDGDKLEFSEMTGEAPTGTKVTVSGTTVTAEAEITVPPGTVMEWRGTATDTAGNSAELVLTINVTESSKPRARAVDDQAGDGQQGQPTPVDVLSNDFNPFAAEGKPLRVVAASVESGTATIDQTESNVTITPGENQVGQVVVRYTIEDATQAATRRAEGRIYLNVIGKPDKPGTPRVDEVGNKQATLTWTAPSDNGSPISSYLVTGTGANGQAVSQECPATTCTITGLTNDVAYRFKVVAVNEVGESAESGLSAEVRPDVRPEAPAAPVMTFGDQQLTVTWQTPKNEGSPITHYNLEIQGPSGVEVREVPAASTNYTWTGLTNGARYTFRVQAINKAQPPFPWSPNATGDGVPARAPDAPADVQVEPQTNGGVFGTTAKVSWSAPPSNGGAPVTGYKVLQNGSVVATVNGSTSTYTASGLQLGTEYTYTIIATNKAGDSQRSGASKPFTPYKAPDPAGPPTLTATGRSGELRASFSQPATPNGIPVTEYRIRVNGVEKTVSGPGAEVTFRDLTNGTSYRGSVIACSKVLCSESPEGGNAKPYGPPSAPQVGAQVVGPKKVKFSANGDTQNNNGRPAELWVNTGGGWQQVSSPWTTTKGGEYGKTYRFEAKMRNSEGAESEVRSASAKTPTPTIDIAPGAQRNVDGCSSQHCHEIVVTGHNMADAYTCTLTDVRDGSNFKSRYKLTAGNGYRQAGPAVYGHPASEGGKIRATCTGAGPNITKTITWPS